MAAIRVYVTCVHTYGGRGGLLLCSGPTQNILQLNRS